MENIIYSNGIDKKENIILLKLIYTRKEIMSNINFEADQREDLNSVNDAKSYQIKLLN